MTTAPTTAPLRTRRLDTKAQRNGAFCLFVGVQAHSRRLGGSQDRRSIQALTGSSDPRSGGSGSAL